MDNETRHKQMTMNLLESLAEDLTKRVAALEAAAKPPQPAERWVVVDCDGDTLTCSSFFYTTPPSADALQFGSEDAALALLKSLEDGGMTGLSVIKVS